MAEKVKKAKDGTIASVGLQMKAIWRREAGVAYFVAEEDGKAGTLVRVPDGRVGVMDCDVRKGASSAAKVAGVVLLAVPDESVYTPGDVVHWDLIEQEPADSGMAVGVVIEVPVKAKKQVLVELNLLSL